MSKNRKVSAWLIAAVIFGIVAIVLHLALKSHIWAGPLFAFIICLWRAVIQYLPKPKFQKTT